MRYTLQIEPKNLKNYASGFIVLLCTWSVQQLAFAAPEPATQPDIRDSGFVYCVSGQVDTFNPQKAGSGLIVDTLAAQLYDRLLDVDPYTYRLVPELAESWEVWITVRPTVSTCVMMSHFSIRLGLPQRAN